ncbi:MAG: RNA polymerase sigma factor [Planctomycetota bacterium]|jgi:RNA polymerase sigma-70 factor (ECF subfamily)
MTGEEGHPDPADAALVRAAIRGDEDAFRSLVDRHAAMATSISYAVTGDAEAARDMAQDAFCDAYRSLRRLRSAKKFAGWLAGIARRKSISWVRARARSRLELAGGREELSAAAGPGPGEDAERAEARRRVRGAIRGLPPGYREAIVLRCLEGRSHADICALLGISQAALDKRLTRAKGMLREVLGDLDPDESEAGRAHDERREEARTGR